MNDSNFFEKAKQEYPKWLHEKCTTMDTNISTPLQELQLRHRLSIGGTAASVIVGSNPYHSLLSLYEEMLGLSEPFQGNYLTRRGLALERLVAERAGELLNKAIFAPKYSKYDVQNNSTETIYQLLKPGFCDESFFKLNLGYSFMSAQIDAFARDNNSYTIVECKTARRNAYNKDGTKMWGVPLAFNDYGDVINGVDSEQAHIPLYYFAQVQWQLLVLKLSSNSKFNSSYAYVAVDIAGEGDVSLYKVYADEKYQDFLAQSAAIFMTENIFKQVPPVEYLDIDRPQPINEDDPKVLSAKPDFLAMLGEYKELDDEIKKLSLRKDSLKYTMEQSLNDKDEAVLLDANGKKVAEKKKVEIKRLDTTALKNEQPEIYKKFLSTTTTYRVKF